LEQIKMCSSRNRRINGGKYKIVECISIFLLYVDNSEVLYTI
jgi:hypothetical protein